MGAAGWCDLTKLKDCRKFRGRIFAAASAVPDGARLFIIVGPHRPEPDAVRLIREQGRRVAVELLGDAAGRWLDAVHEGMPGELYDDPGGGRW